MTLAICDDDAAFRLVIEKNLLDYYNQKNITPKILHFPCGEELLKSEEVFDLVFLDVEMGDINGIETGRELKNKNPHVITFIITSYDGYLDDAFNIRAFRFLPKPLDAARLYKALDDAAELLNNDVIVFYDVYSKQNVRLFTNDIIYMEVEKKKTKLITVNGNYCSNEKISYWRNRLNSISFVTPHSSYIANLDYSITHTRTDLILAKKDADGNVLECYKIAIAPKNQPEIKRLFFYVLERR